MIVVEKLASSPSAAANSFSVSKVAGAVSITAATAAEAALSAYVLVAIVVVSTAIDPLVMVMPVPPVKCALTSVALGPV